MTAPQTFWSRRKEAVQAEARQARAAQIASDEAKALSVQEQKSDDVLLEELGLPDPDTLQAGDDFSAFMSKAVPNRLRNRALRKLWVSNPVLANVDGLVDYGDDFTDAGLSSEAVRTTYQVGKGLMKHVEELARGQDRSDRPAQPDGVAATDGTNDEDPLEAATDTSGTPDTDQDTVRETDDGDKVSAPPKRRMRFVVGDNTTRELRPLAANTGGRDAG